MKNLILICAACIIGSLSTSCEKMFGNFLEKAPGVDITVDTLFSSPAQVEILLAGIYEQGLYNAYPTNLWKIGTTTYNNYNNYSFVCNASTTDEMEANTGWWQSNTNNIGNWSVGTGTTYDTRYYVRWYVIRQANLMLENVSKSPIDANYANQIKGEMKFIRAINYFEAWREFGGQPIIDKVVGVTDPLIKQSSCDSTVNFMLKDVQEAIAVLPDTYPTNLRGRITKGAALMLKAKILLYAASPQWNTATPIVSAVNPADNRFICLMTKDVNRWKVAADAAKAAIDWAPSGGIALVTDKGVDKNFKYVWEIPDNPEIILASKNQKTAGKYTSNSPWSIMVNGAFNSGGWSGFNPTQNFIEKFYDKRDGTPQTWSDTGNDLNQKYAELDYRFKQSIAYNGNYFNWAAPIVETFLGPGTVGKHSSLCITGYWLYKFIPENWRNQSGVYNLEVNWPIFRLADAYLWYAEALNEFNGTPPQAAYDAINIIRSRSGMPNLPTGLTQVQFRDRLIKERAVEFFAEESRFWDVRRWLIAGQDGIESGPMTGLKIYKITGTTPQQYSYQRFVFENRVWLGDKLYYWPHNPTEVMKGVFTQNPLW